MRQRPRDYRLRRAKQDADLLIQKSSRFGSAEYIDNELIRIIGRWGLGNEPAIERWLRIYVQLELEKALGLRQKQERQRDESYQREYEEWLHSKDLAPATGVLAGVVPAGGDELPFHLEKWLKRKQAGLETEAIAEDKPTDSEQPT